ncbi:GguC protein [Amphritea atlantica]|uniref:GguC protein n=1 Tax=Amphritea atlantica TaxID=355243 RepID=A0ABY5GRS5_9GAMM|nr:GguC protein [Amphritea atlantica]
MYLSQLKDGGVLCRESATAYRVNDAETTYALAQEAISSGLDMRSVIDRHGLGEPVDLAALAAAGMLDCPIRHPDSAHMFLTGTGLTHLGSASARDAMHSSESSDGLSDSMKMFRMGIEGGKPAPGDVGVQPEWFYKGTGSAAVAPGDDLVSPDFALDGSEEPEIAGIYVIGADRVPYRIGFAVANEFSDHVTERINYLYLAHSKLRQASFGPEILLGELPQDIRGTSRIMRGEAVVWEKEFLSGEDNMSHTFANLEHHHFKYQLFCEPGDLHVHMFGTATLSFADNIRVLPGDVIEVDAPQLGMALRNTVAQEAPRQSEVRVL